MPPKKPRLPKSAGALISAAKANAGMVCNEFLDHWARMPFSLWWSSDAPTNPSESASEARMLALILSSGNG